MDIVVFHKEVHNRSGSSLLPRTWRRPWLLWFDIHGASSSCSWQSWSEQHLRCPFTDQALGHKPMLHFMGTRLPPRPWVCIYLIHLDAWWYNSLTNLKKKKLIIIIITINYVCPLWVIITNYRFISFFHMLF